MTDPTRLLDHGATPIERTLLSAGASEEPSVDEMRRTAVALGIAAGVGAGLPGTAAAATAASGGILTLAKWLAAGILVAGGAGLGAYRLTASADRGTSPAPQVEATVPGGAVSGHVVERAEPPMPEPEAALPPREPAVEDGPGPSVPARTGGGPGAAPPDLAESIRVQTAMIDEARQSLRAGNAAGTLATLDRYHHRFPRGVFGQEAVLLRVEALVRGGSQAEARALARRFLTNRPNSQYASRIEALVGPVSAQPKANTRDR